MSRRDTRHTDPQLADLADLVMAIARTINSDADADAAVVSLTATEINVMRFIDRHAGASPTAVAAATGLQRSNLSRTLRDLEAKGMVERTADAADRRQTRLVPTARAAANLERLRGNWSRLLSSVDLDRQKLATTLSLLADLDAGLVRTTSS